MPFEIKRFIKIFALLFIAVFVLLNLGTAKKMFDYKLVYNEIRDSLIKEELTEVEVEAISISNKPEIINIEKADSIEIPKINVDAPLVFIELAEQDIFAGALNKGVTHYPESVLPGQLGQTIFLGHSAPPGWPKIRYDWVFSELNDLIYGDQVFIYFNNKKYTYTVKEKLFLDKGEELPKNDLADSKNVLVLLSCWPPGADNRRIAVIASP